MKALIIGATGATGKDLVDIIIQDPAYTELVTFVRSSSGMSHSKLTEIITDFDNLETIAASVKGDVLFSCHGTTLKAAGSKEKQYHIDYEIPLQFAEIAKRNGVYKTVLLSAYGASAKSNIFYSQLKGKLEDSIGSLRFYEYIIFRPGMLERKNTDRMGERMMGGLLHLLNGFGLIKKFKPLPTRVLAEKMAGVAKNTFNGTKIIALDKIATLEI